MYGEYIYLLNRMRSIYVMNKADNMLNVIHSTVK